MDTASKNSTRPPTPASPAASPTAPQSQETPQVMDKGAYVVAHIYVEGKDVPAHDFSQTASQAVKAVIEQGIKAGSGPLKLTLKKVEVDDDPPDED